MAVTTATLRFAYSISGPLQETITSGPTPLEIGVMTHIVAVLDATNDVMSLYQNGSLLSSTAWVGSLSYVSDVNNWLGRSMWGGDANTDAIYNEFRVYDYALSNEEIRGNYLAGPDVVNVPEPGAITALLGGTALLLGLQRRRSTR